MSVEPNVAGVGRDHPGDDVEQRRLAGTVGTDDADDLALLDVEIKIADRPHTAKVAGEAADLEQRHQRSIPLSDSSVVVVSAWAS